MRHTETPPPIRLGFANEWGQHLCGATMPGRKFLTIVGTTQLKITGPARDNSFLDSTAAGARHKITAAGGRTQTYDQSRRTPLSPLESYIDLFLTWLLDLIGWSGVWCPRLAFRFLNLKRGHSDSTN